MKALHLLSCEFHLLLNLLDCLFSSWNALLFLPLYRILSFIACLDLHIYNLLNFNHSLHLDNLVHKTLNLHNLLHIDNFLDLDFFDNWLKWFSLNFGWLVLFGHLLRLCCFTPWAFPGVYLGITPPHVVISLERETSWLKQY